ncbi:hypothetical protein Btru_071846 [Bulinus truncatus]|nr:hypothetical protein Btru_071846 [Bulinus truncatus]
MVLTEREKVKKDLSNLRPKEKDCFHGRKHGRYFDLQDAKTTLPLEYNQEDLINTIQAVWQLTVKVQQTPVAVFNQHEKCLPLTSSGFIKNIRKGDDPCCCFKCKNATDPSDSCAVVEVYTASHAVPLKKPESILCTLFYDGSSKQKTTLRVAKVIDKGSDLCILQCIICDTALISRLESLLQVYKAISLKLHKKYEKVPDEEKFVFIVSHPHGGPKKVSFGHLLMDETMPDASPFLSYSNTTCVGSSGAHIFIAGYYSWAVHIGSRVCSITGVNVGLGRSEKIHNCINLSEIESQIKLEAGSNSYVDVYFRSSEKNAARYLIDINIMDINGRDYTVEEVKKQICWSNGILNNNDLRLAFLKEYSGEIIYVLKKWEIITHYMHYLLDHSLTLTLLQNEESSQTHNSVVIEVADRPTAAKTPVVIEVADTPAESACVTDGNDNQTEICIVSKEIESIIAISRMTEEKEAQTEICEWRVEKYTQTELRLPLDCTLKGNEMTQWCTINQNKKEIHNCEADASANVWQCNGKTPTGLNFVHNLPRSDSKKIKVTCDELPETLVTCDEPPEMLVTCDVRPETLVTCDEPPETLVTCDEPSETLVTCDEPPETFVTCDEPSETLVTCDEPSETLVTCDEPSETLVTCDEPSETLVTCDEPSETLVTCDEPSETLVTCDEPSETLVTCDEPSETLVTCDEPPETLVTCDEPSETLVTCDEPPETLVTCDEPPETLVTCDEPSETLVTCDEPPETFVTCDEPSETLVTCDEPPETLVTCDEPSETLVTCDETPETFVTSDEPPETLATSDEPPGTLVTCDEPPGKLVNPSRAT